MVPVLSSDRSRSGRGAAAVEFALVSLIFFPVLFGLLDYGLWFSDSIGARSGVREAVRRAVVQADVGTPCSTGVYKGKSYPTQLDKMRCVANVEIGAISGPTYVMVKTGTDGWTKRKPLIVCAMVKSDGVTGITPIPRDRIIFTKTRMSIEVDTTKPTGAAGTGVQSSSDTLPAGFASTWSWCS